MGQAATSVVMVPPTSRLRARATEREREREKDRRDTMVTATSLPSGPTRQRERDGERGDGGGRNSHTGDEIGEGGAELIEAGHADDVGPRW
jgi:hypothetical protein